MRSIAEEEVEFHEGPVLRPSRRQVERLAPLDKLIVAALQADGRASWRDIAQLVQSSESTVARRTRALINSGAIRTTAIIDPAKSGQGYPVLLQFRCQPSMGNNVARTLAARPDVRFVTVVTGPFDVVAELIVPSKHHLARFLLQELASIEGVTHTSTETVLRNFKTAYDWSSELLGNPLTPTKESQPSTSGKHLQLDAIDLRLIESLRQDGRKGYPELAIALNITESMARRRVELLVSSRLLLPITLVEPSLLGYEVEVMVWLQVELSQLDSIAAALTARPEVRYLSATSGYSDLVAEIILRSNEDLYSFRTQTLGSLPGIRASEMALELCTVKRAYQLREDEEPDLAPLKSLAKAADHDRFRA